MGREGSDEAHVRLKIAVVIDEAHIAQGVAQSQATPRPSSTPKINIPSSNRWQDLSLVTCDRSTINVPDPPGRSSPMALHPSNEWVPRHR